MSGRLTAARRRLAARHLASADDAAARLPTRLIPRDERAAIARLALCGAAAAWRGADVDGPFSTYARRRAAWAIRDAVRVELRRRGRESPLRPVDDRGADDPGPGLADARDEAAPFLAALPSLAATHRAAVRLRIGGAGLDEVARTMGCTYRIAQTYWRRGIARLRSSRGPDLP